MPLVNDRFTQCKLLEYHEMVGYYRETVSTMKQIYYTLYYVHYRYYYKQSEVVSHNIIKLFSIS